MSNSLGTVLRFPEQRRDDDIIVELLGTRLESEIGPSVVDLRRISQPLRESTPQTGRVAVELEQKQPTAMPEYPQPAPTNGVDMEAYRLAQLRQQIAAMQQSEVRFEDAA